MKQWYILLYYLRSVIFKIENVVNDNLPAISICTCKQQHNLSDAYNLRIHTQMSTWVHVFLRIYVYNFEKKSFGAHPFIASILFKHLLE